MIAVPGDARLASGLWRAGREVGKRRARPFDAPPGASAPRCRTPSAWKGERSRRSSFHLRLLGGNRPGAVLSSGIRSRASRRLSNIRQYGFDKLNSNFINCNLLTRYCLAPSPRLGHRRPNSKLLCAAADYSGSRTRGEPSAQKSVSSVAGQKPRGPGSRTGRGAWRVQWPACVHHVLGMSPRLTGLRPCSGRRQWTQSAQWQPIEKRAAAIPSAQPSVR